MLFGAESILISGTV